MTKQELIETIQAIENGLAMNPTGEMLERLTNRLHRAKQKLNDFDQKKSQDQLAEKSEQLPQKGFDIDSGLKEIAKMEWPKIKARLDKAEPIPPLPSELQSGQSLLEKWKREGYKYTLSAPTKTNQSTIPVLLLGWGAPKEMNRSEIKAEARRYFKAVFTSKKFKIFRASDKLWELDMYCNLWTLGEANFLLTNTRFDMEHLFQDYWLYSAENQGLARELAQFLTKPQPKETQP
jgi:hypothetical protein